MTEMSSRERVLAAFDHREPDRVPTALWGSSYGLTDLAYEALVRYLHLGDRVPPFRQSPKHTIHYYDDRVLDRLGTDMRHVWLGSCDTLAPPAEGQPDAWGIVWAKSAPYYFPVGHPLAQADIGDLDGYPWPDPEQAVRLTALRERLEVVEDLGDYAIVARAVYSYGPFELSCQMRGTENLMLDMALNPDFVHALTSKIAAVMYRLQDIYLEQVAGRIHVMELPGDDYAGDGGPLISPAFFRTFYKPFWAEMVERIKAREPNCRVVFHSDGAVEPLLDDLVDVGIDAITPLEPLPATDMAAVKSRYGHLLTFVGAIDIREALRGTRRQLEAEVKQRIGQLAQGGGYILAPSNHIQADVPSENLVWLYKLACRHGRYVLK